MAALVTPKSAMLAKLGLTVTSGRTNDALEAIEPKPGMVRRSFSMADAAAESATGSSLVNAKMYFSPEPPKPTLLRTAGTLSIALRILFSTTCLRGRAPRSVNKIVSVALRASAAPPGAKGSVPAAPPPIVV